MSPCLNRQFYKLLKLFRARSLVSLPATTGCTSPGNQIQTKALLSSSGLEVIFNDHRYRMNSSG
jgi:hypothetical protein